MQKYYISNKQYQKIKFQTKVENEVTYFKNDQWA